MKAKKHRGWVRGGRGKARRGQNGEEGLQQRKKVREGWKNGQKEEESGRAGSELLARDRGWIGRYQSAGQSEYSSPVP